jgi:hypothetical protein
MLNIKSWKQRHYIEHEYPVICIASNINILDLSSSREYLIATSEIVVDD